MKFFSTIKILEKKMAWGIIGTTISIITFLLGYYFSNQEKKVQIAYEIISETNVLQINKSLNNLQILLNNQNLLQSNSNLKIIKLRIRNNGDFDIQDNQYDKKIKWGFRIVNGKIVDTVSIIDSNSEYIKKAIKIEQNESDVTFNEIIFDRKKFFTLEFMVIYDRQQTPVIEFIGKIVGIDKIIPINISIQNENESFFSKLFHGTILQNIVRLLIFGILFVFIVFVIFMIISSIIDLFDNISKNKKEEFFEKILENEKNEDLKIFLKDLFLKHSIDDLKIILKSLTNLELIKYNYEKHQIDEQISITISKYYENLKRPENYWELRLPYTIQEYFEETIFKKGLVRKDGDVIYIDQNFISKLEILTKYDSINK